MGSNWKTTIENKPDNILNQYMKEKCVQYIQQNNELMQEFSFAQSSTKSKINVIFNSHYGLVGFVWTRSRDDL